MNITFNNVLKFFVFSMIFVLMTEDLSGQRRQRSQTSSSRSARDAGVQTDQSVDEYEQEGDVAEVDGFDDPDKVDDGTVKLDEETFDDKDKEESKVADMVIADEEGGSGATASGRKSGRAAGTLGNYRLPIKNFISRKNTVSWADGRKGGKNYARLQYVRAVRKGKKISRSTADKVLVNRLAHRTMKNPTGESFMYRPIGVVKRKGKTFYRYWVYMSSGPSESFRGFRLPGRFARYGFVSYRFHKEDLKYAGDTIDELRKALKESNLRNRQYEAVLKEMSDDRAKESKQIRARLQKIKR